MAPLEEARNLVILAHLSKLGLLSLKDREALEAAVRGGMASDQLQDRLVRRHGLDGATLAIVKKSLDTGGRSQERITRVERRGGCPARPDLPRGDTAVRRKLDELAKGADVQTPGAQDLSSRYTFLEVLGVGGMGVVHLARDAELKRRVAIKVPRPEFRDDQTWVRALLYEAIITGNLEHPNIIPVYDLGVLAGGEIFYAMKYLDSPTLRAVLDGKSSRARRPLSQMDRVLVFRQICSGVAFAHERGVVHRDLKPANITIGTHGDVTIMDWGIAMGIRGDWPQWNNELVKDRVMGTYEYAAPEQVLEPDTKPTFEADVYSLGVVLFELLTNSLPYGACQSLEDVRARADKLPPLPSSLVAPQSRQEALDAICLRAMHPLPSARYRSVGDLIHDVDQVVSGARERRYLLQLSEQEQQRASAHQKTYGALSTELRAIDQAINTIERQESLAVAEDIRTELIRLKNRRQNIVVLRGQLYARILTHLNRARGYISDDEATLRGLYRLFRTRLEEARAELKVEDTIYYGTQALELARKLGDEQATASGVLSIRSYPEGADISLVSYADISKEIGFDDGQEVGRTPLMNLQVSPDSYLVMARKPGFQDEHRFVFVAGGERASLLVTLSPLGITLGEGGRERELHDLQLYFSDAIHQGRVKITLVEGPPGSGMGHIANSFKNYLVGLPYLVAFISVDCRLLHRHVPLYAISDMIKFRSGIRHGDRKEEIRKKLHDMLLVPLTRAGTRAVPRRWQDQVDHLVDMIGALPTIDLPFHHAPAKLRANPDHLLGEIIKALTVYFELMADWLPVMIFLHNAQWIDPSSRAFLSGLRQRMHGKPLYVVGTVEATDGELPPVWRDVEVDHRVRLQALSPETMERTITKLVNGPPDPRLVSFLLERSHGLPFVTEYLVARMTDEGKLYRRKTDGRWCHHLSARRFAAYDLDDVVTDLIDDLSPVELSHLQVAAIIGRIFWREPLSRIVPDFDPEVLVSLVRKRWIQEHAHSRYPSTAEYTFTLNVFQRRLYETLTPEARTEGHRAVGEWLWEKFRGALEEMSLLGHHYEMCGETADAGIFLQRVGDTCLRFDAAEEALANYRDVLRMQVDKQRAEDVSAAIARLEARLERT